MASAYLPTSRMSAQAVTLCFTLPAEHRERLPAQAAQPLCKSLASITHTTTSHGAVLCLVFLAEHSVNGFRHEQHSQDVHYLPTTHAVTKQ
jgi:hypothetical protein